MASVLAITSLAGSKLWLYACLVVAYWLSSAKRVVTLVNLATIHQKPINRFKALTE